ncbi:hypothetical protein [Rodentibacter genomosp. 2]|uniref:Uncharacterized protein n=1 Tax=Rodentibacter genomosp. 2 TaxID=1908266 RepID=A0A1V3JNY8_9PAST|nr:hypothetical protein [Rodentibacter genomosp. 2]OOF58273.1 hypothetical protein BKK55_02550 [Rodentibacter genomosp. 2]
MKFDVIYKFLLVWGLALSLLLVALSGLAMWPGLPLANALDLHLGFAGVAVAGLLLHFYSRKKKWVKINTQFVDLVTKNREPSYCNLDRLIMTFEHFSPAQIAEQLNLSLPALLQAFSQANINITDSHRTLRENFPLNDEKIFAAITIALKVRFKPNLS